MSLITPDLGLLFWMLVIFVTVFAILAKFAWPVITGMIEERNKYIEDSIQSAKEANQQLSNLKLEAEKMQKEANNEKMSIVREAQTVKEKIISEAKKEAEVEAAKLIENAKASIEQEKLNALKDIRKEVIEMSLEISAKLLQKQLASNADQEAFINQELDKYNAIKKQ
ncbi:MAG: F0F1 ATP synthase subunit B [Paludibacteraceae bacterium]|nr:F0F1 ATP synthase subunit B [Candidatus Physcocola equi]MCQ2233507.1 F0F1 ATP synthase subunit B [Paludibacteraceae bacterium]